MKKIVMALVASLLLTGPALAQSTMASGQARNSKTTVVKTMEIGPDGRPFEQEQTINENLPTERTNAKGKYAYSGIPGKFLREKEAAGGQTATVK